MKDNVVALKQSMAEFRFQTTKNYECLVSLILQNREKRSVGEEPKDGFEEEGERFLQELQERKIREERALKEFHEKRSYKETEVEDVKSINKYKQEGRKMIVDGKEWGPGKVERLLPLSEPLEMRKKNSERLAQESYVFKSPATPLEQQPLPKPPDLSLPGHPPSELPESGQPTTTTPKAFDAVSSRSCREFSVYFPAPLSYDTTMIKVPQNKPVLTIKFMI